MRPECDPNATMKVVWKELTLLCALDYALASSVNEAIETLADRRLVGAIATLPVSDLWLQSVPTLSTLMHDMPDSVRFGVTLTLTGSFAPLTTGFTPENKDQDGALPRNEDLVSAARSFSLNRHAIEAEFRTQLRRYVAHTDKLPDFILLDEDILLFGVAAQAATTAIRHFDLSNTPVICPFNTSAKTMREKVERRTIWKSHLHLKEPWNRRGLVFPLEPSRLPQKGSWLEDGKIWTGIKPAKNIDERLKRLDNRAEIRLEQYQAMLT